MTDALPIPVPLALLADATGGVPSKTVFDHIASGGQIGFVILLLSLVAVSLIVAMAVRLRFSRLAPAEQVERIESLLSAGKVDAVVEYCRQEPSPLTRIVGRALMRCRRSTFGLLELNAALEDAGQHEVSRLYRETDWLGLIAAVAPMLGLLGTVVGMVGAFDVLSAGDGPARPSALAGDISVALITTVLGLVVAIPCTAAFTYFRNRIDQFADDLAATVEHLALTLEAGRRGAGAGQGAAGMAAPASQVSQAASAAPAPAQAPRRAASSPVFSGQEPGA